MFECSTNLICTLRSTHDQLSMPTSTYKPPNLYSPTIEQLNRRINIEEDQKLVGEVRTSRDVRKNTANLLIGPHERPSNDP